MLPTLFIVVNNIVDNYEQCRAAKHCSILFSSTLNRLFIFCLAVYLHDNCDITFLTMFVIIPTLSYITLALLHSIRLHVHLLQHQQGEEDLVRQMLSLDGYSFLKFLTRLVVNSSFLHLRPKGVFIQSNVLLYCNAIFTIATLQVSPEDLHCSYSAKTTLQLLIIYNHSSVILF